MMVLIVQLNLADIISTYMGFKLGAVECNPLFNLLGEHLSLVFKLLLFNALAVIILLLAFSNDKLYVYISFFISLGLLIALLCAVLNNIIIAYEMLHAPQQT